MEVPSKWNISKYSKYWNKNFTVQLGYHPYMSNNNLFKSWEIVLEHKCLYDSHLFIYSVFGVLSSFSFSMRFTPVPVLS